MKMSERYAIGERMETGTYRFTKENIIHFASRFDPQRFHMDEEQAKDTLFGGLCASGWHTCAAWMKTFMDYWAKEAERLTRSGMAPPKLGPSGGFRKLQWLRPVYVGDEISYSVTLLSSRPLNSRPGRIMNTILCEGVNQSGTPVIRFESDVLEFE